MSPRFSVVIPTRARPAELSACLERLAPGAQTLDATAYEVIVADDGEYDETAALLRARFPWARHVHGPRRGPAANRNAGARAASGAWLVFADDDVVPSAEWLAAYAAAAAVTDAPTVLEGKTTCVAGLPSPLWHAPENLHGGVLWSCNFAIAESAFAAMGGFDEGYPFPHMEDPDLRERLKAAGHRIGWVPAAVVDHPPRRQPPGKTLGLYRRAEVRYLYKHGAPRPVRWRMLRGILLDKLVAIRTHPKGLDSFRALWSLAVELWTVAQHASDWERESGKEFRRPRVTSP